MERFGRDQGPGSEGRELAERLHHARKMETVGKLAAGVAHDFNNLLMGIMGCSSLLESKLASESPLREYAMRIQDLSEKAAARTRSLLAFSRHRAFELQVTDVNVAVEHLQPLLAWIVGEDVEVQISLAAAPLNVLADRGQLDQILMNLVTNACDAMPNGGPLRIRTAAVTLAGDSLEAGRRRGMEFAEITVQDTGEGMTRDVRERLFEPFFTTKEPGQGTGLGLSMVHGAVKQLDGTIQVQSEAGRGSSFTILLPLSRAECRDERKDAKLPACGTETVLLADDSPEVRSITRQLLESHGYGVIEAADGQQAIALYEADPQRPALVILDVVMPRCNGPRAHDAIRAMHPEAKILFTSGYGEERLAVRAIREHRPRRVRFLAKPYTAFELLGTIRAILDS